MSSTPFVIEKTYAAPSELVWQAITDKNKMREWYFDLAAFEAKPGFEFEFLAGEEGKEYLHHCKVIEAIPGKKLSYTWRYVDYQGDSLVTFELFPEGDHTRLRLTHAGVETFPASNPGFAKENFVAGWSEIIGSSLPGFIDKLVATKTKNS